MGAQQFRRALEELGTTFKLGQLPSSRPDLYIEELGKLVDQVPPVPFGEIRRVIAEDPPPEALVRVDPEPLATASIAQVHTAVLFAWLYTQLEPLRCMPRRTGQLVSELETGNLKVGIAPPISGTRGGNAAAGDQDQWR